jgi:CBS domain-containing protein
MANISQLLDLKGREVVSVKPDDTVLTALQLMERDNVGSLVVMDGQRLVGIFSERLYARNVFLKGKAAPNTTIREVMNDKVVIARPGNTVQECMAIMTEKRVRHLPVLDGDELVGIISIGDLVKSIISDQKFTIEQLESYIHS